MSRAAALREHDDTPYEDHIVVLHGVSWEDYERVLEMRGDHSAPRINYLEGELEIMSPSRDHEQIKSLIGRLVETWCIDRGIEMSPYGSWTLKNQKKKRGAEADECYIFGTVKRERPQLVIEVEWTRSSIDKLELYEKLGVEEIWRWRKGVILVYIMVEGKFEETERSRLLPDLDLEILVSMLDRDTLTQAVRDFRKALAGADSARRRRAPLRHMMREWFGSRCRSPRGKRRTTRFISGCSSWARSASTPRLRSITPGTARSI